MTQATRRGHSSEQALVYHEKVGGIFGRCIAAALVLAASADASSAQLMTSSGKLEVGGSGAATYSMPIAVPPGTAGMKPMLTLEYSSQGSNGILGIGWSLGGLATITRCPRTMIQNGVAGRINFDANDRFCLEGQQLTAVSGTYGADGAEYRTEIDGFNRITSHGTAGTGPAWFEVRTKAGQIMQFGNTADSRPLTQAGSTARSWLLNRISDTKGNYLTVTYTNDATNGQAYPTRIDYTGNVGAGLTPYNSVQLEYATRPDIVPVYHGGSITKTTVRVTNIKTYLGTTLVSDYRLTYEQGPGSLRSRITSITPCAGDGSCLPASAFTWTNGGTGTFTTVNQASAADGGGVFWSNANPFNLIDFNVDGKSDFFSVTLSGTHNLKKFQSSGDGTFSISDSSAGSAFGSGTKILLGGDFNGDGRTDSAIFATGSFGSGTSQIRTLLANADGTFTTVNQTFSGFVPGNVGLLVGDFNADGRIDFLLPDPGGDGFGQFVRFLSVGDGTFVKSSTSSGASYWNWILVPGDFNGDGVTDFAYVGNDAIHTYLGNGDGTFGTKVVQSISPNNLGSPPTAAWTPIFGDFNGDGKSDFAFAQNAVVQSYLSKGNGTFERYVGTLVDSYGSPPHTSWTPVTGDFNGDGKSDFAFVKDSTLRSYLSQGDGQFSRSVQTLSASFGSPPSASWAPVPGDFNGDGRSDFVFVGSGSLTSFLSIGSVPDLLASITSGLGATTSITYAPLTQSSVYTKDTNATYPVVDMIGAIQVVSRVDAANGIGGTYSTTYSYAGAKSNVLGRFLGFRQMTVQDLQTSIVQTTNFRQDFPYIGLVESTTKKLGALTLNQATNTFQLSNASGGATVSTPTITSAPYRVSVAQNVASSADLDGTAMPTVTTTYQYDNFNNATQIVVSTPDGFSKTTTNTYINDTVNWYLGRLTGASVLSTTP